MTGNCHYSTNESVHVLHWTPTLILFTAFLTMLVSYLTIEWDKLISSQIFHKILFLFKNIFWNLNILFAYLKGTKAAQCPYINISTVLGPIKHISSTVIQLFLCPMFCFVFYVQCLVYRTLKLYFFFKYLLLKQYLKF